MKMFSKKQLLRTWGQNLQIQVRISEAATGDIVLKKVFLKIWQTSQENFCVGFNLATFLKRDSNTRVVLSNFRNVENIYFGEHLRTTASGILRLESRNFTENELCLWYFSRNVPADLAICYFEFPEHLVSKTLYNEWMVLVLLKTESLYYNTHNYRNRK